MKLLASILCFFVAGTAFSEQRSSSERDEAAQEAVRKFLGFNFYAQDRGMHLSPGLISYYSKATKPVSSIITRRWGLNVENKKVIGLFSRDSGRLKIGVVGCVACHSSRAAGQFIVGLGNKNVDVVQIAKDIHKLEKWWKAWVPDRKKSARYVDIEEDALSFSEYLGNEEIGNLTQGLVPVSFIRGWFYRVHGDPIPEGMRRGQIKVPFLWGYEEKRKVGLFCDGYGDGAEVGWAVAVELAAGQKPEAVREYYPDVRHAEELFNSFLPPKYPFRVDENLAERGKLLFSQTCAKCHGVYEKSADGYPIFEKPRFIPWSVVKTDPDRILGNTPEFNAQVDRSPLRDLIKYTNLGQGYFAPRLEGVWSRFPYLHNGSVPSVQALLTKPSDRPRFWSLRDVGERHRFDSRRLGLTLPADEHESKKLLSKARRGKRWVYFTEREGHSNQGHDFYTGISQAEKRSLIEYLKTL